MIAGKDAEIEDLKKRLVALEEQLAEERDNLKKTKVYVRGEGRGVVESKSVVQGRIKYGRGMTYTYMYVYTSGGPGESD